METLTFGDALRKVWKDSGLLQEEFAERLGYRRPTVANMMRGIHLPPLEMLDKLDESCPGARQLLEPLLLRERQARDRSSTTHRAPAWDAEGME